MPDVFPCRACGENAPLTDCDGHTRYYACAICFTTTRVSVDDYMRGMLGGA